jgi:hypothetical protein
MTVLAIGDSVSFGWELSDLAPASEYPFSFDQLIPSQLAYPRLLADRLETDCENLSLVGGSNDRTFRLTVDHVLKQRYDLVVCNWTSIDRFDFTYHKQDIGLTVATSPWQIKQFPWFKTFIVDHYNPAKMTQRFYSNIIALQALLKQLEQPYIFVNGSPVPTAAQHYQDHVDLSTYIDWRSSLCQWCRQQQVEFGPDGHFLEAGHQLVTDVLWSRYQAVYGVGACS